MERAERLNDFAGRGWGFEIGRSLADVRRLGKLIKQVVTEERNRHVDGQLDESRVLYFDGLVVQIYFPAKNYNNLQVTAVRISSAKWAVKDGLIVGSPWTMVKDKLGDPDEKTASSAKYCGESDCVIFSLRDDRVAKITWDLYHD
jgi:hypothetical protein